jgi:hypothetical protein
MRRRQAGGGAKAGRGWGKGRQGIGRRQAVGGAKAGRVWGKGRQEVGRKQVGGGAKVGRGRGEGRQGVGRSRQGVGVGHAADPGRLVTKSFTFFFIKSLENRREKKLEMRSGAG